MKRGARALHGAPTDAHWVSDKSRGKQQAKFSPCYRCGGKHNAASCRFKDADCFHCGKKGHIARVCRSKQRELRDGKHRPAKKQHANNLVTDQPEGQPSSDEPVYSQFQLSDHVSKPICVTVQANRRSLDMEVDTGASLSIISEEVGYLATWPEQERPPLEPTRVKLRTYSGDIIRAIGVLNVTVAYLDQSFELSLQVVTCPGPTLLGRDWLCKLKLNWSELFRINQMTTLTLQSVLEKHKEVFDDKLGRVNTTEVHLHLKQDATPHSTVRGQFPTQLGRRLRLSYKGWRHKVSSSQYYLQIGLLRLFQ